MSKQKIILGTMGLGGGWNTYPVTKEDERLAQEVIETALASGINTFDLADIYTLGKAEEVFGRILKQQPQLRDNMYIQSKAGIVFRQGPNQSSIYNNSKSYIINQTELILKRLQTDYLDTLLIHRPDVLMNGSEVAETFHYLKEKGLVKQFGVSNMSLPQIKLIEHYWSEPLITNQIQLSLGHASILNMGVDVNTTDYSSLGTQGLLEYAQMKDMTIQSWGSLDRGRYTKEEVELKDQEVADLLQKIAMKYEVTPNTIALAWLMKLPVTVHPIIGTTNLKRIKESVQTLHVNLSHQEWYELYITARGRRLP